MLTKTDILDFWFSERVSKFWFRSTDEFDTELRMKYSPVLEDAVAGKRQAWAETAEGALALAIVLDQFPLNMYRGQARSFASEADAIKVTKQAVKQGLDQQLTPEKRVFLYMPLMHSENLADQVFSVALFKASGLKNNLRFARHHLGIIERFGRFPHRNAILGRINTPEEETYLHSDEAFLG